MFDLGRYRALLDQLGRGGMVPQTDWGSELTSETLLLRHDVDFSVDFAHEMGVAEAELGVRSTYFFLVASNMYNLLSRQNQELVASIANLGHKISIHYDPAAHGGLEGFRIEKELFESIFNVEVDIASVHRPGPFLDDNNASLDGIVQTYNEAFFQKITYISDSGGKDVQLQVSDYLGGRSQGLQLLIHPIWWLGRGQSVTDTLNFWQERRAGFIKSEIRVNCKTYED